MKSDSNCIVIRWHYRNCPRRGVTVVLREGDQKTPGERAYLAHESQPRRGDVCVRPSISWIPESE